MFSRFKSFIGKDRCIFPDAHSAYKKAVCAAVGVAVAGVVSYGIWNHTPRRIKSVLDTASDVTVGRFFGLHPLVLPITTTCAIPMSFLVAYKSFYDLSYSIKNNVKCCNIIKHTSVNSAIIVFLIFSTYIASVVSYDAWKEYFNKKQDSTPSEIIINDEKQI